MEGLSKPVYVVFVVRVLLGGLLRKTRIKREQCGGEAIVLETPVD